MHEPFELLNTEGLARRGRLRLAHGIVETPAFMPVGTYGVVKTLTPEELRGQGTQILLGNTYHLYLRPGLELLKTFEGLHRFMHWDGPILTDSGGFQVFSLARTKQIDDEGVRFRSHLNGDSIFLSPEISAEIQKVIGSDIAMVLDECVALPNTRENLARAVERSARWAKRFLQVERIQGQKIFGIVQGGTCLELRRESLERTLELGFDGLAIGGLSVGEPHSAMIEVLENLASSLPANLPHYLMGVGTPRDLLESVKRGIDMFDCVLPTRNARNGGFFTHDGLLNIRNAAFRTDPRPIDEGCECECCRHYSRAYLRHLFQIKEILGCRLATIHNVHYYHRFMFEMRKALESGTFGRFYSAMQRRLEEAYPEREFPAQRDERRKLMKITQWIASAVAFAMMPGSMALGQGAPAASPQGGLTPFIPLLIIFGIFYFLILRPQQKKAKQHQQFIAALKRGEMVVTNSGIIGVVKTVSDRFVTLEVDDGVCLKILKAQILESANSLNKEESKAKGALFAQPQEDRK